MKTKSTFIVCSLFLLTSFAAAAAIGIDDGRQLFVDSYLVESLHGVSRHWNSPVKEPNPVLTGNVFATDGGLCTIHGDELWLHYTGLRGDARKTADTPHIGDLGMYSNGSVGYARLRRDGFAGLVADGEGEIVTKPVVFGGRHFFVNAECNFGSARAVRDRLSALRNADDPLTCKEGMRI